MAFTWTDDLGPAHGVPALEGDYRKAIVVAVNHLEGLRGKKDLPVFSGGTFVSPGNPSAVAMAKAIMAEVAVTDGFKRAQILTVAVRVAKRVFGAGPGADAARVISAMLSSTRDLPPAA